jgi:hypothetical protein
VDLVLVPTQMEESFCLVVSEAQRLGHSGRGEPRGRHFPSASARARPASCSLPATRKAIVSLLLRLHGDRAALQRVAATLRGERPATLAENALAYRDLYRRLVPRPGAAAAHAIPRAASAPAALPAKRARSPLGTDAYDRWLATENWIPASAGMTNELASIPLGHDVRDFKPPRRRAQGEWLMIHEEGDTLAPDAGVRMALACDANPQALLVYCDDDAITARGERYDPALKPGFDMELLRHRPYIAGLCAIHRERFLEAGGLRAGGWAGMADFALRAGKARKDGAVVALRELLCHRLDLNLRAMESAEARREFEGAVAAHQPRRGATVTAPGAPVSVLVRAAAAPQRALPFIQALLQRTGARIAELFIDLPEAQCHEIAAILAPRAALRIASVSIAGQSALALALRNARCEWLAVLDARCDNLIPTWLEQLEQGLGSEAGAAAADLAAPFAERLRGWEVLGAGPWSIAGPAPRLREPGALADLYGAPREVSALAPRFALVRCAAARDSGALDEMHRAGEFEMTHLGLALRKGGWNLLSRGFVAARFPVAPPPPAREQQDLAAPPGVEWMRARWPGAFDDDPFFHPGLQLVAGSLDVAPRFAPQPAAPRVCAFPFDRWGSGEVRVRQPLAALERAGLARVALMGEHESGRAPNALEWRRLGADVLLAHNFFHDYQLRALAEYARSSKALRILGMDDLLTVLPKDNPFSRTIYPDIAARIARAVSLCDRLVVSTQALADAYGDGKIDVRVIPNALDDERWQGLANVPRGGSEAARGLGRRDPAPGRPAPPRAGGRGHPRRHRLGVPGHVPRLLASAGARSARHGAGGALPGEARLPGAGPGGGAARGQPLQTAPRAT